MLADFRRGNLPEPRKFVHGGFRYPQKMRHFPYCQDVSFQPGLAVYWFIRCYRQSIVHVECRIGLVGKKLERPFSFDKADPESNTLLFERSLWAQKMLYRRHL